MNVCDNIHYGDIVGIKDRRYLAECLAGKHMRNGCDNAHYIVIVAIKDQQLPGKQTGEECSVAMPTMFSLLPSKRQAVTWQSAWQAKMSEKSVATPTTVHMLSL
jgi:hypothetical protein